MNFYKFPVGDWSKEGHGKCDWFVVKSSATIEEIREAHFSCNEKLGFEIGTMASEYCDYSIPYKTLKKLVEFKILTVKLDEYENYDYEIDNSKEMIELWIKILNKINPKLKLKLEDVESINFYGKDDKDRHLKTPGYGLFCD
jgi:hypothetical protein